MVVGSRDVEEFIVYARRVVSLLFFDDVLVLSSLRTPWRRYVVPRDRGLVKQSSGRQLFEALVKRNLERDVSEREELGVASASSSSLPFGCVSRSR